MGCEMRGAAFKRGTLVRMAGAAHPFRGPHRVAGLSSDEAPVLAVCWTCGGRS